MKIYFKCSDNSYVIVEPTSQKSHLVEVKNKKITKKEFENASPSIKFDWLGNSNELTKTKTFASCFFEYFTSKAIDNALQL